ncbi:hypothetical protein HMPREF9466_00239 [Fusobacterium necrophorum subsp. funduliforme 1_1_36S]|nr:hypothetical protein HMPREF9466_00239 [Fusobacterium necrophorum subsp. funduliforme 1_1_36S]
MLKLRLTRLGDKKDLLTDWWSWKIYPREMEKQLLI